MWIKIIKTKTLEKMKQALSDIMGKYENLHRLHDGLWNRYKEECQARDKQIEELQAQVRRLEHQNNELKAKLKKQKK